MTHEWATVIKWQKGIATVECNKKSACEGCNNTSCGIKALNELTANPTFELTIATPLSPGKKVLLGVSEQTFLQSVCLIYLLPILSLLMGMVVAITTFGYGNVNAIIGATIGFFAGFLIARYWAGKIETRGNYLPIVLKID